MIANPESVDRLLNNIKVQATTSSARPVSRTDALKSIAALQRLYLPGTHKRSKGRQLESMKKMTLHFTRVDMRDSYHHLRFMNPRMWRASNRIHYWVCALRRDSRMLWTEECPSKICTVYEQRTPREYLNDFVVYFDDLETYWDRTVLYCKKQRLT